MESSTYLDGKMIAASKHWVNVVAHSETTHGTREVLVGREKVTWCKEYWGIACEVHTQGSATGRSKFSGISGVPCTILCDPEGKEVFRKAGGMAASELIKEMTKVLATIPGEHISAGDWNGAKKLLKEAADHLEREAYKKAVDTVQKVSKHRLKAIQDLAGETRDAIEAKGTALIEEALGQVEADKPAAKKLLQKVADEFKPLACSKAAQEKLKELQ